MKKTSVQSNINLETLAGGAFAEKLNEALMQVAENIQNPNTEATTKRQIQITLKFAPNKKSQQRFRPIRSRKRQRRQQANSYRAETSILRRARYLRTVAHRSTSQQPQNSRKATSTKSLQWAKRP